MNKEIKTNKDLNKKKNKKRPPAASDWGYKWGRHTQRQDSIIEPPCRKEGNIIIKGRCTNTPI